MLLPVWLATWELECCHPDVTVGDVWTTTLVSSLPRLLPTTGDKPGWASTAAGEISFVGRIMRPATHKEELALVSLGEIQIGVRGLTDAAVITGAYDAPF